MNCRSSSNRRIRSYSGRWEASRRGLPASADAVVDGNALSASIAAASIVAKVTRDTFMTEQARLHPGYGFERHKGYAAASHLDVLRRLGPLPLHRRSFTPVWRTGGPQPQLAFW
jgi:ribonuclease HII